MSAGGAGCAGGRSRSRAAVLAPALVLLVAVVVAIAACSRGDGGYRVTAEFVNAGQLVKGNEVRVAGSVGRHRRGHRRSPERARPRSRSRSTTTTRRCGAARRRSSSRARCPASPTATSTCSSAPTTAPTSRTAARIGPDQTATAVELDEVFTIFDAETRRSLQDFVTGSGGDAARPRHRAAPRHPLPQPGALHGQPPVRRADARRPPAEALRGRLGGRS